jgi:hypothetical protein
MIDLDILVILDRSGSMHDAKADHEGGLKSFVEDQKSQPGDVRFTLVQFDTAQPCEIVYDRVPMADVGAIELIPRGGTPLLDAVGEALAHLAKQQLVERAQQTIVMVVTDGEENSSREWTKARVKALVDDMEKSGAKILYLGANVDAFSEAGAVGVRHTHAMNYANTPASVGAVYNIMSDKVTDARNLMRGGHADAAAFTSALAFTDEERAQVTSGSATFTPAVTTVNTPPSKTSDDQA